MRCKSQRRKCLEITSRHWLNACKEIEKCISLISARWLLSKLRCCPYVHLNEVPIAYTNTKYEKNTWVCSFVSSRRPMAVSQLKLKWNAPHKWQKLWRSARFTTAKSTVWDEHRICMSFDVWQAVSAANRFGCMKYALGTGSVFCCFCDFFFIF